VLVGPGRERSNCIAVVVIYHLLEGNLPPVAAFGGDDGQLEHRFTGVIAEDGRAGKEFRAQFGHLRLLGPAVSAL